ncbi:MAG: glycosyltransferase family 4 protein [Spirochaetes bacterium]|nr:glycosyltransferase family 4 protein [Spirochaetota bacterium]
MLKKITIIVPDITFPAGTERAVTNLANILADSNKYEVSVLSVKTSHGNPAYKTTEKIKILHGNCCSKNKIKRLVQYFSSIRKNCKNEDIVIGTLAANNFPMLFLGKNCIKIAAEHTIYYGLSFFTRIRRRLFYPRLDAVVVLASGDLKNYSWHKRAVVIANSLSFVPEKRTTTENKIIVSVGRLSFEKGFERLIEAISLIKEKCLDWQVRIIGAGREQDKLQKQIINYGLENIVKILPRTDKMEEEYCQAGICVVSSRRESFGLVLLEAKSCGVPTVSFDCPEGPADIIRNGIDGILVENGNVKALAEAILKLVENLNLRKQFGTAAQSDIDRFKPEFVGKMWFNLFDELLTEKTK